MRMPEPRFGWELPMTWLEAESPFNAPKAKEGNPYRYTSYRLTPLEMRGLRNIVLATTPVLLRRGFAGWYEPGISIHWPGFTVRERPYDHARDGM
jgi:hypothetical protein